MSACASSGVPSLRVRVGNRMPANPDGRFVLYWMTACRRTGWNFGLQRAVDWARELARPLLVVEPLLSGGRWASDRRHRFVLDGMVDNGRQFERYGVPYYPFVERAAGSARELLLALAPSACVVIADDFPIAAVSESTISEPALPAAGQIPVLMEKVDSNGLLPPGAADRVFPTAYGFRRFLQRTLPDHLLDAPKANPLARLSLPRLERLPAKITRRWPRASSRLLSGGAAAMKSLPIDHDVPPVKTSGGARAAERALKRFLDKKLPRYLDDRNQPEEDVTSGLSPHLHFGHISPQEIFHKIATQEDWSPPMLSGNATGSREGWWGMSPAAEAFLDQLVTWRELGFNMSAGRSDYDRYESLPDWARKTLADHSGDRREYLYSLEEFEHARTHDPLWNAAQTELRREGRLHNYLRMLWGKKILEWSADPQEALGVMVQLNNKYALDGEDPNSYSGIFWVLGRYDRPWGPERPIFGRIRYMSSQNAARKLRVRGYIEKYAPEVH